jgi:phosphatidate cytidylyltransferase
MEIYHHLKQRVKISFYIAVHSFTLLFFSLVQLKFNSNQKWSPGFAFVFISVGITDSFSQWWGKLLGKHPLCPQLSPNKTWERFWGRIISNITAVFDFAFLLPKVTTLQVVVIGCIITSASVGGDLLFSYIKRK